MGFTKEFKEFALKGNVMDLAVGVIIGGAFGKIIDSVVNDLIMPVVSALIGTPDFSNMYVVLKGDVPGHPSLADARKVPGSVIFAYGNFITVFINFMLLAFIIFLMIKAMNRLKRRQPDVPPSPPGPSSTDQLLMDIRDELRKKA